MGKETPREAEIPAPAATGAPQPATSGHGSGAASAAAGVLAEVVAAGHRGDAVAAEAGLTHPDARVRAAALGALARLEALDGATLAAALADADAIVRRRACVEAGRALAAGTLDARRTGELIALVAERLDDPEPLVAEAAAWALGEGAGRAEAAVPALVEMATSYRHPLCREAAVAALGAIGDPAGLPAVLAALEDKPAVRRRAATALAAFDDEAADAGLRRCLEDRDWQVRQVAEELLRPS
jgi:HEAT repeat protein